ncbi:MAG: hypothetical protein M5U34_30140 [Chloroflexi bacterium]|nr:hypothetical protein [Chloroflexota bacterium]
MSLTSRELNEFLVQNQIEAEIIFLEEETRTVAEAAAVLGAEPDQIIKSILFLADGAPVLVINNGLARVAWKQLADYLGVSRRRLKTAVPETVLAITGYEVGAVPRLGIKRHCARWWQRPFTIKPSSMAAAVRFRRLVKLTTAGIKAGGGDGNGDYKG